jgi:hypothetical protein
VAGVVASNVFVSLGSCLQRARVSAGSYLDGRHEGAVVQPVKDLSGDLTVHPGSCGAAGGGNRRATGRPKPPGKESESPVRENRPPGSMSARGKPGGAMRPGRPADEAGNCLRRHLHGAHVRLYFAAEPPFCRRASWGARSG